jgi:predicted helicase
LTNLSYRPYVKKRYYSDKHLSDRLTSNHFKMFGDNFERENKVIGFSGVGSSTPFYAFASKIIMSKDFAENTQIVPLFVHNGKKWIKNVTHWGIRSFREYYKDEHIGSDDIFNYVYAVLHSNRYRKKYGVNLKRELPRIPLMKDFWKIAHLGEALMNLHLNYESEKPFALQRLEKSIEDDKQNKLRLEADKKTGKIIIDDKTVLAGIPEEAWEYTLRTRSAIEWILDQYKDKALKDQTLKEKYNNYDFENYKEEVIALIQRIVTLSKKTVKIMDEIDT